MIQLRFYNSLTRQDAIFTPINADNVRMYVCGPTVYSYAHIGNARAAVVFDLLRHILEFHYPQVTHVANITDIDDKIIEAAKKDGTPIAAITQKFADIYNADMAALGVRAPHIQPKATDHVDGMITMINNLIERGHAYAADGHVLFNVPSYADYGQLSGRSRDEQIAGARVEVAPYKRDPADFVLWKPSTDEQPGWESPWGRGRPGWHIECSVMARQYLGDTFDIHGGGVDLTFPHHENEIAQSCCSTGQKHLANYWIHNGFLTVEGEKMSKSLGNVLLAHDLIAQGIPGEAIRMTLLATHYRQPLNWTQDGLMQSIKTLDKWYAIAASTPQDDTPDSDVIAALADDLNTPKAYARLHHLAREYPQGLTASARLMGLLCDNPVAWQTARTQQQMKTVDASYIEDLIAQRNQARTDKDYARSDQIRDELASLGITIKDGPDGTQWSVTRA